jgi:hypothetical protein
MSRIAGAPLQPGLPSGPTIDSTEDARRVRPVRLLAPERRRALVALLLGATRRGLVALFLVGLAIEGRDDLSQSHPLTGVRQAAQHKRAAVSGGLSARL